MQAIATLVNDDPYMHMTAAQRQQEVKRRRDAFFPRQSARVSAHIEPPQKAAEEPAPREPWFKIVGEGPAAEPRKPFIQEILIECAKFYGVSRLDILSSRRTAIVIRPRQVSMYLAKTMTPHSLPEIGRRMGDRDHTTVLHGVRKIARMIENDADLASDVAHIATAIESRVSR